MQHGRRLVEQLIGTRGGDAECTEARKHETERLGTNVVKHLVGQGRYLGILVGLGCLPRAAVDHDVGVLEACLEALKGAEVSLGGDVTGKGVAVACNGAHNNHPACMRTVGDRNGGKSSGTIHTRLLQKENKQVD